MKKETKNILIVALILYIVLELLGVVHAFDPNFLTKITSLGNVYIPMTTVILLAYVWDRGDDKIAKLGLVCIGITIIFSVLTYLKILTPVYSSAYSTANTMDKILDVINTVATLGTHLASLLALFSLIPITDETSKKLQSVAVITYIVYALIVVSGDLLNLHSIKVLSGIRSLIYSTSLVAEYGMIITYLLNKKESKGTPPVQGEPQAATQMPVQQQVPAQMPVQPQVPAQMPIQNQQVMTQAAPVQQPSQQMPQTPQQ